MSTTPLTSQKLKKLLDKLIVPPGKKISLQKDYDPGFVLEGVSKAEAPELLKQGVQLLANLQDKLYAQNTYALLVVLQAMDAAGKDSAIKHVMSGINPQGCEVHSFKAPSTEELDHDYMWRCFGRLPQRGRIGIFNRSYYEEVLILRVHPELLEREQLPPATKNKNIWQRRYEEINNFERYLVDNGIIVVKCFLNVSQEEQKKRFLERINRPEKNWKFSLTDVKERAHWNAYMEAYEDAFNNTSTHHAPWHVIPADKKWFARLSVAALIYKTLARLNLTYPSLTEDRLKELQAAKKILEAEK